MIYLNTIADSGQNQNILTIQRHDCCNNNNNNNIEDASTMVFVIQSICKQRDDDA